MPINWTNCPRCAGELARNSAIVEGAEVKLCRACKRYCLQGDDKWFDAGKDTEAELKARHELINRSSPETQWQEAFDSESDDPRWNL